MMGGGGTDWLTPILVLSVGLVAGIILAITTRSRRQVSTSSALAPEDIRDLRTQKDALITRLRELEVTSVGRSPEQISIQRYQLELEAAQVWMALDRAERARSASTPVGTKTVEQSTGSRWTTAAVWVGGSAVFGGALVFALLSATSDRAPGGSLTGNTGIGPTGPGQEAQPDPDLVRLMAVVAEDPRNHEAHLDLAQAFIYRERLVEAFQVVQAANAIQPGHARALTYEAVVRQAMGMGGRALELLDAAVEKDPTLAEAWVRRGLSAFELSQWQKAIDSWEQALKVRPDGQAALGPVIEEAKKRLAGGGEEAPPAAPHQQPVAAQQQPAAAPSEDGAVKLLVDLDPAAKGKVPPGAILFVYARAAGVTAGPPIAAKRIPVTGNFPIQLTLGPSDSMMGQPFPTPAMIEARLDADGNAMTRDPSDPRAAADQVSPGGDTVRLMLRVE